MSKWIKPQGYIEKKYNYLYRLNLLSDPRYYYYGVHSTDREPSKDGYEGSGSKIKKLIKENGHKCFSKTILQYYNTREELLDAEEKLVTPELLKDEFCLNLLKGGGTLDTTGFSVSDETKKILSERFKGRKRTKDSIEKMITTRRARGTDKHTDETKEKIRKNKIGRIPIVKDGTQKSVRKDEINEYLKNGWVTGYTAERNIKVSKSKMGNKNPNFGKHWGQEQKEKMITTKKERGTNFHSEETKRKLAELNRLHAKDPEFRRKLSEATKGVNTWSKERKFINKNGIEKSVNLTEINKYLSDGWALGRNKRKRDNIP